MARYAIKEVKSDEFDVFEVPAGRVAYAIVGPTGKRLDWPLLDTIEEARKDLSEFYAMDSELNKEHFNEALWTARMAGDLEA